MNRNVKERVILAPESEAVPNSFAIGPQCGNTVPRKPVARANVISRVPSRVVPSVLKMQQSSRLIFRLWKHEGLSIATLADRYHVPRPAVEDVLREEAA